MNVKFMNSSIVLLTVLFVAGVHAESSRCDRQCVQTKVDQYVAALVAHNPAQANVPASARSTQNGVVTQPGEGVWQSIVSQGDYRQTFVDESLKSATFFGAFTEANDAPLLMAIRFQFDNDGKVSELEHLLSRPDKRNRLILNHKLTEPNPVYDEILPISQRSSADTLMAAADAYFDGIANNTDDGVPMDPYCNRRENGVLLLKNTKPESEPCPIGFHRFNYITDIRDRRVSVIDQERGLVLVWAFFDIPGNIEVAPGRWGPSDLSTSVGERVDTRKIPRSLYIAELFRVVDGDIRDIEAIMFNLDLGTKAGWE